MSGPNEDVASYLVTKHSAWKGKYKRIFGIGNGCITTYNPGSMEITNQWQYHDFFNIAPALKGQVPNEFMITMRKGKKVDHMRFSSEFRADMMTEALVFRHKYAENIIDNLRTSGEKIGWNEYPVPVVLEVTPCSIDQLDPATGSVLTSYFFRDLESIIPVSGIQGGICLQKSNFGRLHIFSIARRDDLIKKVEDNARKYIGITITCKKVSIPLQKASEERLGTFSGDDHITSLCEFPVYKISLRHNDPVRRIFCLSETCLLERDPNSYAVVSLHPLSEIFALVRNQENPQMFTIEYISR